MGEVGPFLRVAIVAGEESGDQLGAKLMEALSDAMQGRISFEGVGGHRMRERGFISVFPMDDIAVMGVTAVVPRLPTIVRRVHLAVDCVCADHADVLIIIDSPDFTHAVARRVRKRLPSLPIVDYVSPSVWAWRPGRAARMRAYVDHVLALLPFEPEVHRRLGGPACTYVGHPLIEKLDVLSPSEDEARLRQDAAGAVLVMPGSRRSVAARMLPVFRDAVALLDGAVECIVPAVPHLADWLAAETSAWPSPVTVVVGEEEKFKAFRRARSALVCSGTSTLELALSGIPMVVGYRVPPLEALFLPLVKVPSIVLPNLILGENAIPEFLQGACTPDRLSAALAGIHAYTPERTRQVEAFAKLRRIMDVGTEPPSRRAARIVIETVNEKRGA